MMPFRTVLSPRLKSATSVHHIGLRLECLERREIPTVNVLATYPAIAGNESSCGCAPPDPDVAASSGYLVGTVNTAIAFFDKSTGQRLFLQSLGNFFRPIGPGNLMSDPVVTFDDTSGRFFVGVLDIDFTHQQSFFDFAVSNDDDPFDGFDEMHRIETTEADANGNPLWSDYPKLGFNADAFAVSLNMDPFSDLIGGNPDHGQIITFDKSTLLDRDPNTLTYYSIDTPGPVYAPAPATMHGSQPGDPLYFVQEVTRFGGDSLAVLRMDDPLSGTPTITSYEIPVTPYDRPPMAQDPGSLQINLFESFVLNADWRNGRLVATHDIGVDDVARARWYEFSTDGDAPTLTQSGDIDQGPGVYTFFSAIALADNADIGMTFEESSATEYLSMFVTGQAADDPAGTMQTAVVAQAGTGVMSVNRAGDYSGIVMDPGTGNSFWVENMYKPNNRLQWATSIASFQMNSNSPVPGFGPALAGSATAHTAMTRSSPAEDQVIPNGIRATAIWFSDEPSSPRESAFMLSPTSSANLAGWAIPDSFMLDEIFAAPAHRLLA